MGLPLEKASLLATIHGVSQVVGVLTILPLSDRIGRRNTIALSNGFITIALTGLLFAKTPMTLYLIVGLLAVFYGATFPVYGASAGDYFPKEVLGTVIGAWTPFYGIGAILSHWATGLLRDRTGVYDQAFMLTAMMAGTAFVLILFLRKTVPGRETGKD
jgi:MFS family permease